jgi:hypothetical protein
MRLRDPYLIQLKMSVLTDPLRNAPAATQIPPPLATPNSPK